MSRLDTLVPDGPWSLFYTTRCQVYWGVTQIVFLVVLWFDITYTNTHTPTQRHTTHSGVSRLPQPCKYIFTPLVMTSQQLYHTLISFDDEPTLKDMSSLNLHALS